MGEGAPDAVRHARPGLTHTQAVFLEARAVGAQLYECVAKVGAPASFEWAFRAPEATLQDRSGQVIGRHYAGPTWEANDGSRVVGEVLARDAGPDASAIPWLLLRAKSTAGSGVLQSTQSIQRIRTVGGIAPAEPCDAASVHRALRVPYSATYRFFGTKGTVY